MKRILILLTAMMLLICFAGCGVANSAGGDSLHTDSANDIMTSGNFNTIGDSSSRSETAPAASDPVTSSQSKDNSVTYQFYYKR